MCLAPAQSRAGLETLASPSPTVQKETAQYQEGSPLSPLTGPAFQGLSAAFKAWAWGRRCQGWDPPRQVPPAGPWEGRVDCLGPRGTADPHPCRSQAAQWSLIRPDAVQDVSPEEQGELEVEPATGHQHGHELAMALHR